MLRWKFSRPLTLVLAFVIFVLIINYVQPYYFSELKKIWACEETRSVIVKDGWIPRKLRTNSEPLDVGILIIIDETTDLLEYEQAMGSLKCYAALHGYPLRIEVLGDQWKTKCPQNFMFARHCVASSLLGLHNWTLFIDADVGVFNPDFLIERFISTPKTDIIFYDRIFDFEVAAGSYLARNTSYAVSFLLKFAEIVVPPVLYERSYNGSDNAALHWLFLTEFYESKNSQLNPADCWTIYEKLVTADDLFAFEACCRLFMGESRLFFAPNNVGVIQLLPKGTAWMRDIWLTEESWVSPEDFMLHGFKTSNLIPSKEKSTAWQRATRRLIFGAWHQPLDSYRFDLDSCHNGSVQWRWRKSQVVEPKFIRDLMNKEKVKIRKNFIHYISKINDYL